MASIGLRIVVFCRLVITRLDRRDTSNARAASSLAVRSMFPEEVAPVSYETVVSNPVVSCVKFPANCVGSILSTLVIDPL